MPKVKDPERVATGRIGAYKLHGLYDSRELTRAATAAVLERFRAEAREVAEARGEKLSPAELERRAISLRKSHMQRLAWERERRRPRKPSSPSQAPKAAREQPRKVAVEDYAKIRRRVATGESRSSLAEEYGCSLSLIRQIVNRYKSKDRD